MRVLVVVVNYRTPELTADCLASLAGQPGASWTSIEGSMLSADISGFTALSEKLAGKGKAGAEEITSLINTCFTALIDSAYDYRGEVIKFGGDALLVLFRGDPIGAIHFQALILVAVEGALVAAMRPGALSG